VIQTRFLTTKEFKLYRTWLNERSADSLALYFGVATNSSFIDSVVDKIVSNTDNHYFLVATIGTKWVGVIHMAQISATQMEFGVMVDEQHRGEGIADALMCEAINWIQNRNFDRLYLHCLNRNTAMKHLASKHGLELHEEYGDIEAITHVPPPSILSYAQEALTVNKNIFFLNLQNSFAPFSEIYG
jgi:RimJ/RimL family protein N-acetyltransferase